MAARNVEPPPMADDDRLVEAISDRDIATRGTAETMLKQRPEAG
nr:hypothetical protein [Bradyrhizobium diazoefficiens]